MLILEDLTEEQIFGMSEDDVRAVIIDRVLLHLGYNHTGPYFTRRGELLRYPYVQIGRKGKNDVELRGFLDYRCGIDGRRGSFIIEAKRGNHNLSQTDFDQAHSYAAHPEVRAQYFVLSNGRRFDIYETLAGPTAKPIISLSFPEIRENFFLIENILSPQRLRKHCERTYDMGKSITQDFGSRVEIVNGVFRTENLNFYFDCAPDDPDKVALENNPVFLGELKYGAERALMNQPVKSGYCARDEDGRIFAFLEVGSADPKNEKSIAAMGIDKILIFSNAETVSSDENEPTIFETLTETNVPAGTEVYVSNSDEPVPIDAPIDMEVFFKCIGYVDANKFIGTFDSSVRIEFNFAGVRIPPVICVLTGNFDLTLVG